VRQTDDRQADHAMEKCVGICGIACTARAIPPNNRTENIALFWREINVIH